MDQQSPNRRLSEISHLFLSDVRDRQTDNAPRPVRKPPGSFNGDISVDLTPEEFAQVFSDAPPAKDSPRFKPVRAVIAHHLGENLADRVRDFAGTLCQDGGRVGVIFADAASVRICCIEPNPDRAPVADDFPIERLELTRLEESVVELNHDVDQWLIVFPDPRFAEARDILSQIPDWTLLSGVDHDSVVAGYRALKGCCDLAKPRLSIAVFGASDEQELDKTFRKIASVCEQFLQMRIELFGNIDYIEDLAEHVVLRAEADANGPTPQWTVIGEMLRHAEALPASAAAPIAIAVATPTPPEMKKPVMRAVDPMQMPQPAPQAPVMPPLKPTPLASAGDGFNSIVDLPGADTSSHAIASAVLRGGNDLVESPIKAPAHPEATIAVSRDHRLVLLAAAKPGLTELTPIAKAYQWMTENRALIAMAIPQFAIDVHALPRLELLVDQADISADVLQPLMATGNVLIHGYRKLRWGEKTGLLLEAA